MSHLTCGPSFKVKQWFTGFGELSFWWIQICIGSPMRRSSYYMNVISTHCLCSGLVADKPDEQLFFFDTEQGQGLSSIFLQ